MNLIFPVGNNWLYLFLVCICFRKWKLKKQQNKETNRSFCYQFVTLLSLCCYLFVTFSCHFVVIDLWHSPLIDKKLINTEHDYVAWHEGKKQQIHQTFRPKSLSVDNKKRYGKQHKYKTCLYKQVDPFSVSCHWPQLMFCESSIAICLLFCLQLITCSVVLFI